MTSLLTGILGTLIGVFIGNRFALGRDRRKEYNDIVAPLFENLERLRLTVIDGKLPNSANSLNMESFISLLRVIPKYKSKALKQAINDYESAKRNCGTYISGIYDLNNPEELLKAIEKLQKLLPSK